MIHTKGHMTVCGGVGRRVGVYVCVYTLAHGEEENKGHMNGGKYEPGLGLG